MMVTAQEIAASMKGPEARAMLRAHAELSAGAGTPRVIATARPRWSKANGKRWERRGMLTRYPGLDGAGFWHIEPLFYQVGEALRTLVETPRPR